MILAAASGWAFEPQVVLPLGLGAALYLGGARRLRGRRGPAGWAASRTASFLAGLGVLFVALVSPLDGYADSLLSVHMAQHLLLTLIAPPLLLLGRPVTLAYAALPRKKGAALAGFARRRAIRVLGSPGVGFASFAVTMWASHLTPLYEATLTNEAAHAFEHGAYLTTALLFWWPVVARDPGSARLSHPARVLYLFLGMPVMSLLGLIVGSGARVLYPHYVVAARSVTASALADQRLAGTIMWESSMLVSAIALSAVLLDWMRTDESAATRADARRDRERRRQVPTTTVPVEAEGR